MIINSLLRSFYAHMKPTDTKNNILVSLQKLNIYNDQTMMQSIRDLYENREYIEDSPMFENLVSKFETYILQKDKCTPLCLQVYYKLKEMNLMTNQFRHNLHRKYFDYLINVGDKIKNQNLEKFLWFICEQSIYQRQYFLEASDLHTLKLFQIYEYMSSLDSLPTWQPFIRVAHMLKIMGHDVKMHKNIAQKKVIDSINYKYYPYIANFFDKNQSNQVKKTLKYDIPFLIHLSQQYLIKNTSDYDEYLQSMETRAIQQDDRRPLDTCTWSQFGIFLKFMARAYTFHGTNEDFDSQTIDLFFRLIQYAQPNLQTIIFGLSTFAENPYYMYNRKFPIVSRLKQHIFDKSSQEYSFLPIGGYINLLENANKVQSHKESVLYLQKFLLQKIERKAIWNPGDTETLMEHLKKNKYAGQQKLLNFLKKRQEKGI